MKIGILEPKRFSKNAIKELNNIGNVEIFDINKKLKEFIEDKEIIFIRLKYYIGVDFFQKAKLLKYLCTPTTGLTHIDLDEAEKRNIMIISLKGHVEFLNNIHATPEHTIGLIIALLRNYKNAFLNLENPEWNRDKYWGNEIYKNKIGIIGFGRVGKILAKFLEAFEPELYYFDIDENINPIHSALKIDNIENLIQKSNIIILSASYSKESAGLLSPPLINLMKDKFFINISRGELIDEDYLIEKIISGHFKGVGLDVISNETREDNRLKMFLELTKSNNLILTPHISGATYQSISTTENFIVEKLRGCLN